MPLSAKGQEAQSLCFPLNAGAVNSTTNRILTYYVVRPGTAKRSGTGSPILRGRMKIIRVGEISLLKLHNRN